MSAVYGEFREARHIIPWTRQNIIGARWVIGIDWGLNRAVAVAIQVLPDGRWIVCSELVRNPESRGHFRADLRNWIEDLMPEQVPFLISADRAIPEENMWLRQLYGARKSQVLSLTSKHDQYVRNGVAIVQDMLAPVEGEPRLLFAESLPRTYPGDVAGIVPSMAAYRYEVDREGNPTDVPAKDNVHDHAVDALRYAVVAGARFKELNGGRVPNRPLLGPDGIAGDSTDGKARAHF